MKDSTRRAAAICRTASLAAIVATAPMAGASLLIDVRAFSKNGSTAAITDPKLVPVTPGDTIVFRVFADVTGNDDNLGDCIQDLSGSFLSTGTVHGDLLLTAAGITSPFGASGSSAGAGTDLDGDGDLDLGSNSPADPAGHFAIRSASLTGPRWWEGYQWQFPPPPPTRIPDGWEYRIVTNLRMVVAGGAGSTLVNFRTRPSNTGGFWAQDATEISTDNGDGTTAYSYTGGQSFTNTTNVIGSGVVLQAVPEPAALGLAALASLGLLARRTTRGGVR